MELTNSALLTDLYQLNMIQAYLEHNMLDTAVFEFFVRKLPPQRGFLLAAGLEPALSFLENLRFSAEELQWLAQTGRFGNILLDYLSQLHFIGDIDALPEGSVCFPDEPLLRLTAPLPLAQLVESRLINLLHYSTLIMSKAARMILLAPGKTLIDFGLRRAHGAEAGMLAARASFIAGFDGTATLLAEKSYGVPAMGTMAHSFIEAFDDEMMAFEGFARACPRHLTLLIDTYDTEAAAHKVVTLAPRLKAQGITISGVRIDSGDLLAQSRRVREILDAAGLQEITIFVSGGIDEAQLRDLIQAHAPIAGFGIGTSLTTSFDLPALDCAYKLQEYAGLPRRKLSPGKMTWPGRKQVWRQYGVDGRMSCDILTIADDHQPGTPLIRPVLRNGRRVTPQPSLTDIRQFTASELARLPEPLRRLEAGYEYPVQVAEALKQVADAVDHRVAQQKASG
jgi:nicotinate phosphoribosyltransferase